MGFYGAKFAEYLSDSTIWGAAELKLVDFVKIGTKLQAEIAFEGGSELSGTKKFESLVEFIDCNCGHDSASPYRLATP